MKQLPCLILILIFVVSCYGAAIMKDVKNLNLQDQAMENQIKRIFKNITTFLHDNHPSINEPIREVTNCIAEEALEEAMEELVIKSYHGLKTNATLKLRNKICKENKEIINSFIYCLISGETHEFRDFLTALSLTSEFLINEFCQSPDINRLPTFMNEKTFYQLKANLPAEFVKPLNRIKEFEYRQITPFGEDLCLPVRIAESVEVMAILSQKFPFHLHGAIGNLYHLITTITFDYPFKAYHQCV